MHECALIHGTVHQKASHFAGVNWNSFQTQRTAQLCHVTHHWIYRPALRGSPKSAWHATASSLEGAHEKKRKQVGWWNVLKTNRKFFLCSYTKPPRLFI